MERFCCNFAAKSNNKTISIMKREKKICSVKNAMSKQLTVVAMVAGLTLMATSEAMGQKEVTKRQKEGVVLNNLMLWPETIARAEDQVYECVEQMPSFPSGEKALKKFLNDNIRYPAETCAQGRVIVQFVVEVDGRIDSVKVVRKLSPELDCEAVRVVKLMPKWNPGRMNGVPVRVKYIIPVRFNAKQ